MLKLNEKLLIHSATLVHSLRDPDAPFAEPQTEVSELSRIRVSKTSKGVSFSKDGAFRVDMIVLFFFPNVSLVDGMQGADPVIDTGDKVRIEGDTYTVKGVKVVSDDMAPHHLEVVVE